MSFQSLEQKFQSADTPLDLLTTIDSEYDIWSYPGEDHSLPDEFTSWIEEQRAWRETCSFMDQSYHMVDLYIEGSEAIDALCRIGVNDFEGFEPGTAKQLVLCNHEGYIIGDTILFYLEEERLLSVGNQIPQNWIRYNLEKCDGDVVTEEVYSPFSDGAPEEFRYEVQGPNAMSVMEAVTDESLPDIPFFNFDTILIDGTEVYSMSHGMAGEPGMEIFGPYEAGESIKERILAAGQEFGIRQLGVKSYMTTPLESGWIPRPVPAIYKNEEMKEYREWLGADSWEANYAIGGSYTADSIEDYYLTPMEMGYQKIVDFDHDFIGKEALERKGLGSSARERVTLVWDDTDVIGIFESLFQEGETNRFIELPTSGEIMANWDSVTKNGETIGMSINPPGYNYNEREMLSLACIDSEFSQPGTQVSLVWGETNLAKSNIERHAQTTIRATVAPVPYVEGRRE